MRIAIPLADGRLCLHFGHCQNFAVIDVDENKQITGKSELPPPPHQPGVLPRWLADQGVEVVIAGGMGRRALDIFAQNGVQVVFGAPPETPEKLVTDYLEGALQLGDNACDH